MLNTDKKKQIIVALDFSSESQALAFTENLDSQECRVKVGKELFTRAGPLFVKRLVREGFDVFLDLKFHDIPNTTAAACAAAADLGVWMLNVHALGGRQMMAAAKEGVDRSGNSDVLLIAVTILTSLAGDDLHEVGLLGEPKDHVLRLASLAQESGLDGVVCSAQEAAAISGHCGKGFVLVTPGIRPAGSATGDQKRVLTPVQAIANGAHYLVIGRPITQAGQPMRALKQVHSEIGA